MARPFRKSHREDQGYPMPLTTANYIWAVDVRNWDTGRVSVKRSGVWTTAILTIERSTDGITGQAIGAGVTLGPPGSGVLSLSTDQLDLQAIDYLIVRVSTVGASDEPIDVFVHGKATSSL